MYVSNSYVLPVEVVYKTTELNAANKQFYLRKMHSTTGFNFFRGKIVDWVICLQGTTNNFQYNYWCSPVENITAGHPLGAA
jgi:hypothetical protein